jgi:hypothetical protein
MELTPFSIVNQYTKERLLHHSRYSTNKYSFLKIFQHGLSYALNKNDQKLIKNYLGLPMWIQLGILYMKSLRSKTASAKIQFKETILLDPVRLVNDEKGNWHSIYFDKIVNELGRNNVTWISLRKVKDIQCDCNLEDFARSHPYPDAIEKDLLHHICLALKQAKATSQFSGYEIKHISSALHIFYEEFRFYYNAFKGKNIKTAFFICHYHNEGLIAALRFLGVKSIEVQHGLIASNDLYYVYHEQFAARTHKGFFPDQIMVYGPYWKRLLETGCEFRARNIHVAGDYLFRSSNIEYGNMRKENVILVCAQKNMHIDYVRYAHILSKHIEYHKDWRGIIKMHPLEKEKEAYYELRKLGFEIVDHEKSLDDLLRLSKIQISIYSTTFYDALGFDVVNFSLQDYGSMSDYASDMISEGVATSLTIMEDPIVKYLAIKASGQELLPREDVYATFDSSVVQELLYSSDLPK